MDRRTFIAGTAATAVAASLPIPIKAIAQSQTYSWSEMKLGFTITNGVVFSSLMSAHSFSLPDGVNEGDEVLLSYRDGGGYEVVSHGST